MKQLTREQVVENTVDKLFTNGFGEKAQRLVLMSKDGRDLGGWCKSSVRDVVLRELDAKPRRKGAK